MPVNYWDKLLRSISSTDSYIGFAAVIALLLFVLSLVFAREIAKRLVKWRAKRNVSFSKFLNSALNITYTLFTTFISLFPLLGMFGTVIALLGLDLSAGDMENIKNNFFNALTSTAWGIIFSILFKLLHAPFANYIENQIEDSKKMSDEYEVEQLTERG